MTISRKICYVSIYTSTINKKKVKKTIFFTIAYKRIKCLGINLIPEMKGLHTENYKTLLKETIENTDKQKNTCAHELVDLLVKISILQKTIYRFNAIPIKMPVASLIEIEKLSWNSLGISGYL